MRKIINSPLLGILARIAVKAGTEELVKKWFFDPREEYIHNFSYKDIHIWCYRYDYYVFNDPWGDWIKLSYKETLIIDAQRHDLYLNRFFLHLLGGPMVAIEQAKELAGMYAIV